MLATMPREHDYYVYIVASRSRTLYIGVTNALLKRIREHREGKHDGFTQKYKCHRLEYFERFQYIDNAIDRGERTERLAAREKDCSNQ